MQRGKYTGKASSVASIIDVLRPFNTDLYGAMYAEPEDMGSTAPHGCIWTKQIDVARHWLKAFLERQSGALTSIYSLTSFMGTGTEVRLRLDASPWGIGGVLYINEAPKAWYAAKLDDHDVQILKVEIGESSCQQIAECLAQLVGLRIWGQHWQKEGIILAISADNMTSLHLADSMRSSSPSVNLIAREMALTMGDSKYRPSIRDHLPGVANKVADALSRKVAPRSQFQLPRSLLNIPETKAPVRDASYYLCRPKSAALQSSR